MASLKLSSSRVCKRTGRPECGSTTKACGSLHVSVHASWRRSRAVLAVMTALAVRGCVARAARRLSVAGLSGSSSARTMWGVQSPPASSRSRAARGVGAPSVVRALRWSLACAKSSVVDLSS